MAVLAIVFVAVALLKPWAIGTSGDGGGAPASGSGEGTPSATLVPEPTIAPVRDPNAMACLGPIGVELLSLVRWPGHEIRTWQPTAGAIGDDPLDRTLVPVAVLSSHVLGLGLCEETSGEAGPSTAAARLLDVVSLPDAGVDQKDLGDPIQITLPQTSPEFGVLFGPPVGSGPVESSGGLDRSPDEAPSGPSTGVAGGSTAWPVGTYALSFQFAQDSPSRVRWLVFRIAAIASELK